MKRLSILLIIIFTLSLGKTLLVPEEYLTIQQALISAKNGDTIAIQSNTYFQPDRLNIGSKSIFIQNLSISDKFTKTEIIQPLIIPIQQRTMFRGWEGQRLVNQLDSVADFTGEIACDQQGIPLVVWWGRLSQDSAHQIFFTRWNGTNWNEELMLNPIDTFSNYQPRITFDGEDRAWVAWTREEGVQGHGDYEIFYTRWNGTGWVLPLQLNPTNPRRDAVNRLAYGGNQLWIVTWTTSLNNDPWSVFTSHWNGVNWDTLIRVSPTDSGWHGFSSITVDNIGRPHFVWSEPISGRIYYRMRSDTGWTAPIWINDPNTIRCADWAAPKIAVDDNNNLHVVWVGIASGENDQDIFYSKYNGQQWVTPIRLNINDDCDEYYPDITASSPNNIWVIWDKEPAFWESHPYVKHFDGINWSQEEKLDNDSISYFNSGSQIALSQNVNPWTIWCGLTCGIDYYDIYSNRHLSIGVEENEQVCILTDVNYVNLVPNPTSSRFNLELNRIDDVVLVYNLAGKLVKQVNWTKQNRQIDISNLPDGVYFISSKHSNKKILSKVVKIGR